MNTIVQSALGILKRNLVQPFSLTLLNVGATNFGSAASGSQRDLMSKFFGGASNQQQPSASAGASLLPSRYIFNIFEFSH